MGPTVQPAAGREARVADEETGSDASSFEPSSFDAFYRAEYRAVLAFAVSLCRDLHAAEDLTQDAFIAAQRRWDSLRAYERPDLWVRRAVANRSVSRWRRLTSDQTRVRRLARVRESDAAAPEPDDDVWRLVRALPARQAQVIALTYLEDRSIADVAAVLGIGVETAKTHLQRGKAALARTVRADEQPAHASPPEEHEREVR